MDLLENSRTIANHANFEPDHEGRQGVRQGAVVPADRPEGLAQQARLAGQAMREPDVADRLAPRTLAAGGDAGGGS